MPTRLCAEAPCPEPAIYRSRCATHARTNEYRTHDRDRKRIYSSKRWQILRRRVLFEQPLCACGSIATDVHHRVDLEDGGDPWARSNLEALCHVCHSKLTRRNQR